MMQQVIKNLLPPHLSYIYILASSAQNFQNQEPPQNSRHQKGDMKKGSY